MLAHEEAAASLVRQARPTSFFALVSESTGGFVTARPPPHKQAMLVMARDVGLSVHSVFATLPSGHVLALGTRALLGLCAAPGTSAPLLCTGYRERSRDPHMKFLRSPAIKSTLTFRMNARR